MKINDEAGLRAFLFYLLSVCVQRSSTSVSFMLKVIISQVSLMCDTDHCGYNVHQYPRPCGRTGHVHTHQLGIKWTNVGSAGVTNRTVNDAFINRLGPESLLESIRLGLMTAPHQQ